MYGGKKKNSHTLKSKPALQPNKSKALQKSSKELKCLLLNREEQLLKKMEKLLIISAQSDSFRGVVLINRLLCKVFFKGERGQEREREKERPLERAVQYSNIAHGKPAVLLLARSNLNL